MAHLIANDRGGSLARPTHGYFTVQDLSTALGVASIDMIDLDNEDEPVRPDSLVLVVAGDADAMDENTLATILVRRCSPIGQGVRIGGPAILATVAEVTHPEELADVIGG